MRPLLFSVPASTRVLVPSMRPVLVSVPLALTRVSTALISPLLSRLPVARARLLSARSVPLLTMLAALMLRLLRAESRPVFSKSPPMDRATLLALAMVPPGAAEAVAMRTQPSATACP